MKRRILLSVLLLTTLFTLAAKKKSKKSVPLTGSYTVAGLPENNKMRKSNLPVSEIIFNDKTKKVSIYLGCNRISGEYEMGKSNTVRAKIVSSTKMACSGNDENLFKNNFHKITRYRINGNKVELYAGKKLLFLLSKSIKNNTHEAEGEYTLERLFDGKKMLKGDYTKTRISIAKNKISCNVGCNGISGDFISHDNRIEPLKLMMTEMFCEKVDALEKLFTGNLNQINRYQWNDDLLEFYKDETLLMILKKDDR